MPCERKSVEPMAAITAPHRTAAPASVAAAFLRRGKVVGREGAGQGARDGVATGRAATILTPYRAKHSTPTLEPIGAPVLCVGRWRTIGPTPRMSLRIRSMPNRRLRVRRSRYGGADFYAVGQMFDMPSVWAEMAENLQSNPQCGHLPQEGQPEMVTKILMDFLDGWAG
jgi:hypothetical protein